MNWLDIAILIVIVIPTLAGLKSGLIKAILSLAGVVVGVMLAGHYHTLLATKLTFISSANLAEIVAFAIILMGTMIVAGVLAAMLKQIVSAMLLGWVNRLGGALFGFLIGAIFSAALLTMWAKFLGAGETITTSALATLLLDRFPMVLALLPAEFDSIRSFFQ